MPQREGGVGLRAQSDLRGVAYLGSWLGCLEGVRDRCPATAVDQAAFQQGDHSWAAGLRDTLEELTATEVHLSEQGEVVRGERPGALWAWEDGCAPVAKAQRQLTRAVEAAALLRKFAPVSSQALWPTPERPLPAASLSSVTRLALALGGHKRRRRER